MRSILIISNTYYQLITAIRLRETCWSDESVDIVISDQSNHSEETAENLKGLNIFDQVFWVKTKRLCQDRQSIRLKFKRIQHIIYGMSYAGITDRQYDELVYYNPDIFAYGIFSKLVEGNKCLICSRYEEGVLSYADSEYLNNSRLRYTNIIRRLLHKELLEARTSNFYCFYPQFYSGKLKTIAISKITDCIKMGSVLKRVFHIEAEMLKIREKYIFFTGVFDFEGGGTIGEFELVLKIAELVGKENLIVKKHPRDTRILYEKYGITVYKNSSVPWEAIQLNFDFTDKIFLTVNSGSILGANLMLRDQVKSYFLYNCCDVEKNAEAAAYIKMVKQFMFALGPVLDRIEVIESLEKINKICDSE